MASWMRTGIFSGVWCGGVVPESGGCQMFISWRECPYKGIIGLNLSCARWGDFSDVESVVLTVWYNFYLIASVCAVFNSHNSTRMESSHRTTFHTQKFQFTDTTLNRKNWKRIITALMVPIFSPARLSNVNNIPEIFMIQLSLSFRSQHWSWCLNERRFLDF